MRPSTPGPSAGWEARGHQDPRPARCRASLSAGGRAPPAVRSPSTPPRLTVLALLLFIGIVTAQQSGPGPCSFLPSQPGEGAPPLARDVDAALAGRADEFVVGALGIQGSDSLYQQWNSTFSTYMTDTVGKRLGKTFRLVYLDFDTAYLAAANNCLDFVFSNPSMHLCLELEYGATPMVTLLNFRQGQKLDRFYGVIFTRANRTDINTLYDIEGKIMEGVSVTGLGAAQLQWHEMWSRGINFMDYPGQVRFSYDQDRIVQDVVNGDVDVGLVRTDLAESLAAKGLVNISDIKVINKKDDSTFPFDYSTTLAAPEWPLAAFPHISQTLRHEIATAMYAIKPTEPAALKGQYAGWVPPVSYMGLFTMMGDLGFLKNNRCTGDSDTYNAITCSVGTQKVSQQQIDSNCDALAAMDPRYTCPENFICVCDPCEAIPPPAPLAPMSPPVVPDEGGIGKGASFGIVGIVAIVVAGGVILMLLAGFLMLRRRRAGMEDAESPDVHKSGPSISSSDIDMSVPTIDGLIKGMSGKQGLTVKTKPDEQSVSDTLQVLELLATSGNSRVYRALWRGATVAQKRIELPSNPAMFEKKQSQMAMEAAISASMSHPNVVQTYKCEIVPIKRTLTQAGKNRPLRSTTAPELISDKATEADQSDEIAKTQDLREVLLWEMHIIQEFCNLGSVTACLAAGTLEGQEGPRQPPHLLTALSIAKDVASGMLHIHSLNILHADLKSGNVLLVDTRRSDTSANVLAKVADFGLSVKMDASQTHISGVHAGTLTHMSPELLQDGHSSKAADVYAYGIFLYELFTGQKPWKGEKPAQIIHHVVHKKIRPVFPVVTDRRVVELATACWAQEPEDRPTFEEILIKIIALIKVQGSGRSVTYSKSDTTSDSADGVSDSTTSIKKLQIGSANKPTPRISQDSQRLQASLPGSRSNVHVNEPDEEVTSSDEDEDEAPENTMVFVMDKAAGAAPM